MNLYFIEHIRILVYYRMVLLTYSDEFQHFSVFTYVTVSFRLETSWDWRVCKGVGDGGWKGLRYPGEGVPIHNFTTFYGYFFLYFIEHIRILVYNRMVLYFIEHIRILDGFANIFE